MGLKEEYSKARQWVANELRFDSSEGVSFFETIIRVIGGLITAFELSGDQVYLQKARECADKLMVAFDTSTGLPLARVAMATGFSYNPKWQRRYVILAEVGTIQMEFHTLSRYLKDDRCLHISAQLQTILVFALCVLASSAHLP